MSFAFKRRLLILAGVNFRFSPYEPQHASSIGSNPMNGICKTLISSLGLGPDYDP
jgi:hypothetical protein